MSKDITPDSLFEAVTKILIRAGVSNSVEIPKNTTIESITPGGMFNDIDALLIRYANDVVKSSDFGWLYDSSNAPEIDLKKDIEWLSMEWLSPCVRMGDLW